MLNIIKAILNDIICAGRCLDLTGITVSSGVEDYFRAEYKKDAKYAYEYWRTTGSTNFDK
jgi:hypothetical protein